MDFPDVVAQRRMVRNFEARAVDPKTLEKVLASALKAPSAGFTQGVDLLVLVEEADRARYWVATTTPAWRDGAARAAGLMRAPVIVVPVCDPDAYARRYSEDDKAAPELGTVEGWPVPYWWVDGAFVTMTLLLGAVDAGLGAGFLGLFRGESALFESFGVPQGRRGIGAVLIGHPATPDPVPASVARGRRPFGETVHFGAW